jgi:hypothetical protein
MYLLPILRDKHSLHNSLVCTIKNYEIKSYYVYLSSFGGKIRQMNIQLVRENLEVRKSAKYAPRMSLPTAVERQDCRPAEKINQKYPKHCTYLILLSILSAYFLFMYAMDCLRLYFGFCSYKLEFYHERLSVSQKARIKHEIKAS